MSGLFIGKLRARLVCGCAGAAMTAGVTFAQSARISLPAMPLSEALRNFARQTGENILFTTAAVSGLRSSPISGQMSPREAIEALIRGTNLEAIPDNSGGFIIRRMAVEQRSEGPPAPVIRASPDAIPSNVGDEQFNMQIEEVVVTGTSIRGVDLVGANIVTVDQATIKAANPVNAEELLDQVPLTSTANGPPQGTNINSSYAPQIHQLAGSASNSTLTLIDGLRGPGTGSNSLIDPSIIPMSAIQRVEVLAGGSSSVYGSDAVSGVVNLITRKSYSGLQLSAQVGEGNHYANNTASLLWGTKWDSGSVMIAGGYIYQSNLPAKARKYLIMGDYTSIGGTNYDELFGCPTATIVVPGNSGVYLSPSSTTTVANTQASHNCNTTMYGDALPKSMRRNALVKTTQAFLADRLAVTLMLDFNALNTIANNQPGAATGGGQSVASLQGVTVYGPGSGKGVQLNPFFKAPAGSPTATEETINWVDLMGLGPDGHDFGQTTNAEEVMYATFSAAYGLGSDWQALLSDSLGQNNYTTSSINSFNSSAAILALNGTAVNNASTATTDVAGQSVIATNLPLTAFNALDVWNPPGDTNQTSAQVINSLYRGTSISTQTNTFNQTKFSLDGSLFELPAGWMRAAAGAEYYSQHLITTDGGSNGTGYLPNGTQFLVFRSRRQVVSGYGELDIPIVSPKMEFPLVRQIVLDLSARYDKYNDVGPTFNPKFAVDWTVVDGLKIRANYSTSFVAPPIGTLGDPSQGGETSNGATIPPAFNLPVAAYPQVTLLPGCATAVLYCSVGGGTAVGGLLRQYGGAIDGVRPQRGKSWNIGLDLSLPFLPGFLANFTIFNTIYIGGVTGPNTTQITSTPALQHLIQLYPSGATQSQIDSFTRVPQGATIQGQPPNVVYFTVNKDSTNLLNLSQQGIDLSVAYDINTDIGRFHIGTAVSQLLRFYESSGPPPYVWFSILNTSGLNSTFPSVATQNRSTFGWSNDVTEIDTFINYTGGYHNVGGTTVHPNLTDANGNFAGGGDPVSANMTFDLHVAYNFTSGMLQGDQLFADVKNISDRDPPFYNYANHGAVLSNNGYNPFVSNPIGRLIAIGLRAGF